MGNETKNKTDCTRGDQGPVEHISISYLVSRHKETDTLVSYSVSMATNTSVVTVFRALGPRVLRSQSEASL